MGLKVLRFSRRRGHGHEMLFKNCVEGGGFTDVWVAYQTNDWFAIWLCKERCERLGALRLGHCGRGLEIYKEKRGGRR